MLNVLKSYLTRHKLGLFQLWVVNEDNTICPADQAKLKYLQFFFLLQVNLYGYTSFSSATDWTIPPTILLYQSYTKIQHLHRYLSAQRYSAPHVTIYLSSLNIIKLSVPLNHLTKFCVINRNNKLFIFTINRASANKHAWESSVSH